MLIILGAIIYLSYFLIMRGSKIYYKPGYDDCYRSDCYSSTSSHSESRSYSGGGGSSGGSGSTRKF